MKIETFPDGSTIETHPNGSQTVVGPLAHTEYFRRMREGGARLTGDCKQVANQPPVVSGDPGRAHYEANVRAVPKYHDGTPRKSWAALPEYTKDHWRRMAAACEKGAI